MKGMHKHPNPGGFKPTLYVIYSVREVLKLQHALKYPGSKTREKTKL